MRNNKGFISTGVIYSFFLVFIIMVLGIVLTYSSRRILLNNIKSDVRKVIDELYTYDCFREGITNLSECILYNAGGSDSIEELTDFSEVADASDTGIYKTEDDYGESYYYRGNIQNNYVKFGTWETSSSWCDEINNNYTIENGSPMYWRIVRINGDGTIRLIYDGTTPAENGTIHNASIGFSPFNDYQTDAKYAGYIYDGNTSSTIKTFLENWYEKNLIKKIYVNGEETEVTKDSTNYNNYIADSIFCNDTTFDEHITNNTPRLNCAQETDELTVENGKLTYPIGLITADELIYSGFIVGTNCEDCYMNAGIKFFSLTPQGYTENPTKKVVYYRAGSGLIGYVPGSSAYPRLVRPVINLKADTKIKRGTGTIDDPFILEEVTF